MSFMKPVDWLVVGGGVAALALLYGLTFLHQHAMADECAKRGGVRVETTCIKRDAVLP